MSEYPSRGRRNKTVPMAALFVVLIAAALAAYWLIAAYKVTWDPVKYVPQDAVAAVVVDVTGSGDKRAALQSIQESLNEAGLEDPGKALVDRLDETLGIRFEPDLIQHLNGRAAIVVIPEMSGITPGVAAILGARGDNDAAALKELMVKGISKGQTKISRGTYEDYNYTVVPNPKFKSYVGVVDGGVVCASTEFALKKIIDTLKSGKCLRDNAEFARMNKTDDSTVATAYFSGVQCEKMVGPMLALMGQSSDDASVSKLLATLKDNVAAVGTLNAGADRLILRVRGVSSKPMPQYGSVPVGKLAANAPDDAVLAFSINGMDTFLAEAKKQLMADPAMGKQIQQGVAWAKFVLDTDPFADALDRITALSGYYVPGESIDSSFPGHLTLAARVDKPKVVQTTVGKIHSTMTMSGAMFSEVPVAGNTAYLGPDNGPVRFSDAMVDDKYVLVLSGKKPGAAVSSAVMTAAGKAQSLADSASFKSISKHLPENACALVYCDLGAASEPLGKFSGADVKQQDRAVIKKFGRFAFTSSVSGNNYELCAVLPLRK